MFTITPFNKTVLLKVNPICVFSAHATQALNSSQQLGGIYTDAENAFNQVHNELLVKKFEILVFRCTFVQLLLYTYPAGPALVCLRMIQSLRFIASIKVLCTS